MARGNGQKKVLRLDKFLADAGIGTRSEVKKMILAKRLQVNDEIISRPEYKVDLETDCVYLDKDLVNTPPEFEYYLFHKPAGCVTATEDSKDVTVMDYIHTGRRDLFPVGRLDKDTEGLLLITNDGDLAHAMLSPKRHVDKTYYARINGIMDSLDVRSIAEGIDYGEDHIALPGVLEILTVDLVKETSEVLLTIREGKFHQVKRMVEACGKEVTYLRRISMGPLKLPKDLLPGDYRALNNKELQAVKALK